MSQAANKLPIDGGEIVIQSCDYETANVGIYLRGRITYHHVSIPGLEREWRKIYYSDEIKPDEFDAILQANKSRLLETIERLCAPVREAHSPTANLSPLVDPDATDGRKTGENGGVAACKCARFGDRTEHGILKIVVE